MSVQTELDRIISAVEAAHEKVAEKGGTTARPYLVGNLETAIDTIPNTGGVVSWNDLTDKPFYKESGTVEVLAEFQPTFDEDSGMFVFPTAPSLVVGESYVVRWNGDEYNSVAFDLTALLGGPAVGLGDIYTMSGGEMGTDATGEPFVILSAADFGIAGAYALDGATAEVTVGIWCEGEVVHRLDSCYLPNGTPYAVPFDDVILEEVTTYSVMSRFTADIGEISVGNVYNVVVDGTTYPCIADTDDYGITFNAYYNDSEELVYAPFNIVVYYDAYAQVMGYNLSVELGDLSSSGNEHVISIKGGIDIKPVTPMLMKPDPHPVYIVDFDYDVLNGTYTTAETGYSISRAYDSGLLLIGRKIKNGKVECGFFEYEGTTSYQFTFTRTYSEIHDVSRLVYRITEVECLKFSGETGEVDSNTFTDSSIKGSVLLESPSGSVFEVTVSDDGTLSAKALEQR